MNTWIPNGCELTRRGRSDLKEAIRCVLLAGAALAGSHFEEAAAQQSVVASSDLPPKMLESIQVVGYMVQPETIVSTPMSLNFGNATLYIDGVRQDSYLGPVETSNYEQPVPVITATKNPQPDCRTLRNNPVDISNGMKHVHEVDFQSISNPDLKLSRYKNPLWMGMGIFGLGWISNLDVKISSESCEQVPGKSSCEIPVSSDFIKLYTEQGGVIQFVKQFIGTNYGAWYPASGETGVLERIADGADAGKYVLHTRGGRLSSPKIKFHRNGQIESITNPDGNNLVYTYDSGNRLTKVTHSSGRSITLSWSGSTPGAVTSVTAPNGASYNFEYYAAHSPAGSGPLLRKVNYPDGKGNIEYVHPSVWWPANFLLQIKVNGQALTNYTYHDASGLSNGMVASSSFVDGTNLIKYSYFRDGYPDDIGISRTEEINGYGKKTTYLFKDQMLVETIGGASVHCSATANKATYNAVGLLETTVNESGVTTKYEYDSHRRKVRQIEGLGTSQQRTTTWQWDSDPNDLFSTDLIKKITVDGLSSITYGYRRTNLPTDGLLSSITTTNLTSNGAVGVSQTLSLDYTFHPNGLVASVVQDGPLPGAGDYKKMFYNSMGDLVSVENSLGQVKTFSGHNGFGQPGRIVDVAGAVTEYEYDTRGRVVVERTFPNGSPAETRYVYGASGLLEAKATPDGNTALYHYDAARRLIQEDLTEPGGSYAVRRYTYDAMSNPTKIEVGRDN